MRTWFFTICLLGASMSPAYSDDCTAVAQGLDLPQKIKTEGKPKRLRWGAVNKLLPKLRDAAEGTACRLTFAQAFTTKKAGAFFPLIDSVLRTAPESSLEGLAVFFSNGREAGRFSNRVVLEKGGYHQYYFQFIDRQGNIQASPRDLIDLATGAPLFVVRWDDLQEKTLLSPAESR